MSIKNLLNKKCSWRRRINTGLANDYGEIDYSDVIFGSDVPCSRQVGVGMNMRQMVENLPPGEFDKKLVKYYLAPTDIQEGDLITFEGSETEKVRDVRDAGGRGHHLEIVAVSTKEVGEGDSRVG